MWGPNVTHALDSGFRLLIVFRHHLARISDAPMRHVGPRHFPHTNGVEPML